MPTNSELNRIIAMLKSEVSILGRELLNVATVQYRDWEAPYNTEADFVEWARSRSNFSLGKVFGERPDCMQAVGPSRRRVAYRKIIEQHIQGIGSCETKFPYFVSDDDKEHIKVVKSQMFWVSKAVLPSFLGLGGLGTDVGAPIITVGTDVRTFIRLNFKKARSVMNEMTSYGLKHKVEEKIGRYVSNGELIAAMIFEGYECLLSSDGDVPNCLFKMRKPVFK